MSNLEEFALHELEIAGLFKESSDYGGMLGTAVMELIKVFGKQGHSGMSASICLSLFNTVAKYEPLSPLLGDDSEWFPVSDGLWQNKRCPRVFKDTARAYDVDGTIFRYPDGCCVTKHASKKTITFPYIPISEYVDIPFDEATK